MKHLLNNLSEEEKNSIREQHEGGMKLDTSRFRTLLEGKSGDVKPLVEQEDDYPKINLRKHFDKERELNPDLMGDDEWDEFNNDFEDEDIEIYDRKHFEKEQNEPSTEDTPLAPMEEDDSDYRMYDLPSIHQDIEDELMEMSDDEAIDYLKEIIEFCEDKLSGYDEESEDEEDFGFAQHDGDFGGDDSEFEDEEELDLREFDELEEDGETW